MTPTPLSRTIKNKDMKTDITLPDGEKVSFDRHENGAPFVTISNSEEPCLLYLTALDILLLRDFLNQLGEITTKP